jgi:hypothetical protein
MVDRQQGMRHRLIILEVVLLVAACLLLVAALVVVSRDYLSGEGTQPGTDQEQVDGLQNNDDLASFHFVLTDNGIDCGPLQGRSATGEAEESGHCETAGGRLVLSLWADVASRDAAVTNSINSQLHTEGYCHVVGRGQGTNRAWSVDASGVIDVCHQIAQLLGGEVFENAADDTVPSPAPAQGAPAVEQYSGAGASVVTLTASDPRVITIAHTGDSNFAVFSVDARGQDLDLLVNEIGSFSGMLPLNFLDGDEARALRIEADGEWSVTSAPLSAAPVWEGSAPFSAEGPAVVRVAGAAEGLTPVTLTHEGESNFAVLAHGDGRSLLVNEIGVYTGETLLPAGTLILQVEADGPWSIAKS